MTEFYVKSIKGQLVAAKYLTFDNEFILDRNYHPWTEATRIYDQFGNPLTNLFPEVLIVPETRGYDQSISYVDSVKTELANNSVWLNPINPNYVVEILKRMGQDFKQGGTQDWQRSYIGNTGIRDLVPAFINSTSFFLGLDSAAFGLPEIAPLFFGGEYNRRVNGNNMNVDKEGPYGLSKANAVSISAGYDFYKAHGAFQESSAAVYIDFDINLTLDQSIWSYNLEDVCVASIYWPTVNPASGEDINTEAKFTVIKKEATVTVRGEQQVYPLKHVLDSTQDAQIAEASWISKQAEAAADWFTRADGAQTSFATWLANNIGDMVDGNLSADEAFIGLARQLGQDYLADFASHQWTADVAGAKGVVTEAFKTFGLDDKQAQMFAGAAYTAVTRMAVDFVFNGDAEHAAKAGLAAFAGSMTAAYMSANKIGCVASSAAAVAAVTTAVMGLVNSGEFDDWNDWAALGAQVGIAAGAAAGGAAIGSAIAAEMGWKFAAIGGVNPISIVAGAVIALLISKVFGKALFGGGVVYHAGEFPTKRQVLDSIYRIETVTLDGQQVQALVAVNPKGSTIVNYGISAIIGGSGADVLAGGDGDQTMIGNAGADYMEAKGGDDTILGGTGNDLINGGAGNDVLQGDDGDDHLFGEAGDDTVVGAAGEDFIHLGSGDDIASGGDGNDYILAGGDTDSVDGGAGNDMIDGGYGDDELAGGALPAFMIPRPSFLSHCHTGA